MKKFLSIIVFSCLFVGGLIFLYVHPPKVVPVESGDYVRLVYCRKVVTTTDIVYVRNGTLRAEFLENYKVNWTETLHSYVIHPNGSVTEELSRQYANVTESLPYAVEIHSWGLMAHSGSLLVRKDMLESELAKYIYKDKMRTSFGLRECEVYVYRFSSSDMQIENVVCLDKANLEYRGRSWYLELRSLNEYNGHEQSVEVVDTNLFNKPVWKLKVYSLPLKDWTLGVVAGWTMIVAIFLGAPWMYTRWKRHRISSDRHTA